MEIPLYILSPSYLKNKNFPIESASSDIIISPKRLLYDHNALNTEDAKFRALKYCVDQAIVDNHDLFLFALGEIELKPEFDLMKILDDVEILLSKGVDLIIGNALAVEELVPLTDNVSWIDFFFGSSVMIFLKPSFKTIQKPQTLNNNSFEITINELLNRKLILHDFLCHAMDSHFAHTFDKTKAQELLDITTLKIELYKNASKFPVKFKKTEDNLAVKKMLYMKSYPRYIVLKEHYISMITKPI